MQCPPTCKTGSGAAPQRKAFAHGCASTHLAFEELFLVPSGQMFLIFIAMLPLGSVLESGHLPS